MKLSAIVITKDAAKILARVLASLKFADEIIVVDSGSQDATLEVAKQLGARVFSNPWPGYGQQKNYGLDKARGEWALFIDADEEVTLTLQKSVLQAIDSPVDFYWLRIVTVFLGKPLKHLYGHNPRLFRKAAGHWTNDKVHEQVATRSGQRLRLGETSSKIIPEPLIHHSHATVASYIKKMHRYTTLDAQQMKATGQHRSGRSVKKSWLLPWQLASRQFVKLYLYRQGFLDGYAGFMWSLLSAWYEYEMGRKFLRL